MALKDIFATPPSDRLLLAILAISLLIHAVSIPFALRAFGGKEAFGAVVANQQAYLRRVIEKDRAKGIAPELAKRITMPPPPDNPQEFVAKTMGESLVQEIEKVVAPLLDVKATAAIVQKVAATLKDELRAAAAKMSDAKLSEKEIKELQEKFRARAQTVAVEALKVHRIDTQVERAAMSTTEGYEKQVSPHLFGTLFYEMYGRPSWAVGPRLWYTTWPGGNDAPRWANLESLHNMFRRLGDMEGVKAGIGGSRLDEKTGRSVPVVHESWPGPNEAQARFLKQGLFNIFNRHQGGYKDQELLPSWDDFMNGGPLWGYGVVAELYPHRAAEMKKLTERIDQLWTQAIAQAEAYIQLAESGAEESRLKAAQQACFQLMAQIKESAEKLPPGRMANAIGAVNNALLNDMLRDRARQDKLYKLWVTSMVSTLEALIRRYAEGQFAAGIIKNDVSAEEALKRFPDQILPFVDRDVRKLLSRKKFGTLIFYPYRHSSPITGEGCPPSDEQCEADRKAMAEALRQFPELKAYAEKRRALLEQYCQSAIENTVQGIRKYVFTKGLLTGAATSFAEGVDYTDEVEEKLDVRKAAWEGRGQDYARLTKEGLPDTAAPLIALFYGLGKGSLLEPVPSPQAPAYAASQRPQFAWRTSLPHKPPRPAKWGFETQGTNVCPFSNSSAFEGIPFLANFPALDGDLADWGRIRPLVLHSPNRENRMKQPILLYAAWNYQGFMFGYKVQRPATDFFYSEQYRTAAIKTYDGFTGGVQSQRNTGTDWMCQGDYLRLLFDTLDARTETRGDPHTQEFVVLPMGSDTDPTLPGFERIFASKRKATKTQWRNIEPEGKVFIGQPPPQYGPDGSGPYRVTKVNDKGPLEEQGYTVEVLIPRSLFKVPVFCPGWYVGFDCAVATGFQRREFNGQHWLPNSDTVYGGNCPKNWGDLLLLGTDPYIVVQDADEAGTVSESVIPGHSYLITVIDPDRNVHLTEKDTVLVSAETDDARPDMEVFILEETEANSGIFRGYLNTQPGRGREVQGVLEVTAGQTVRLGYVDIGNAKGQRNVISEIKLPVVSPCLEVGLLKR